MAEKPSGIIRYLFEAVSPGCHPESPSTFGGCAFSAETLEARCSVCGKPSTVIPLKSPSDGHYPSYFEAIVEPEKREMQIIVHFRKGVEEKN